MSEHAPNARADMKAGALYAVIGENGWIFYGQVTPEKNIGFFQRRDRQIAAPDEVLASPVMSVICVAYPSITRALRSGQWTKIGRFAVTGPLMAPQASVQWSLGTLGVTVWRNGEPERETRVEDPAIQDMELMAVWDAEHHIPARLTADFGAEPAEWDVGGPIRRERAVREERARRWPDRPSHQLPVDWVPVGAD